MKKCIPTFILASIFVLFGGIFINDSKINSTCKVIEWKWKCYCNPFCNTLWNIELNSMERTIIGSNHFCKNKYNIGSTHNCRYNNSIVLWNHSTIALPIFLFSIGMLFYIISFVSIYHDMSTNNVIKVIELIDMNENK